MCGVFGYLGKEQKDLSKYILKGLSKLEYRGYDSAGMAILKNSKFTLFKETGEVKNLKKLLGKREIRGSLGIGHTRWATHGGVTKLNAHPHFDCKKEVVVVHNGIIENYLPLKKNLVKKGHRFVSETDTEVVPHLIEEEMKKVKKPVFWKACRNVFRKLKGLNAIVALGKDGSMAGFRNGSPLVVGVAEDGFLVSSDIPALAPYTSKVVLIEDIEGFFIKEREIFLLSVENGKVKKARPKEIKLEEIVVEKGRFKHFLIKEIFEQPQVILRVASNQKKEIEKAAEMIKKAKGTFFTACGTASHAGLAATYMFSEITKRHVNFPFGSEFPFFEDFLIPQSLLIAASQLGETMDTLEAVKAAKRHKAKVLALVNVPGSTLERIADYSIDLKAGPEKAVLSTKAYIAKLSTFLLLAFLLDEKFEKGIQILQETSKKIKRLYTKEYTVRIKKLTRKLFDKEHIYVIGRGINYATALEGALKIKESSYLHAEGFAGGELKHGVIALIEKKTPCIVIVADDRAKESVLSNVAELKARGAYIIGISPTKEDVFDYHLKVPNVEFASPIINIIPMQLLAYYLTILKGYNPDKPRNLAKSVTVK